MNLKNQPIKNLDMEKIQKDNQNSPAHPDLKFQILALLTYAKEGMEEYPNLTINTFISSLMDELNDDPELYEDIDLFAISYFQNQFLMDPQYYKKID